MIKVGNLKLNFRYYDVSNPDHLFAFSERFVDQTFIKNPYELNMTSLKNITIITECYITNLESGNDVCAGFSFTYKGDQFNKSIGRKIALARAIAHMSRLARAKIWQTYFEHCRVY